MARQTGPSPLSERRAETPSVFLNLPYDSDYISLYLAYIAGITALGLFPRSALEVTSGTRRLNRIFSLIKACPYSVHDLSCVKLNTRKPPTPRFNMPFELALAFAWQEMSSDAHTFFVFEAKRGRIEKSLSDLNGTDVFIHDGQAKGLFRELCNAFVRPASQPTVQQMVQIFEGLDRALPEIKRRAGAKSPFTPRVFTDLRVMAADLSRIYVSTAQTTQQAGS